LHLYLALLISYLPLLLGLADLIVTPLLVLLLYRGRLTSLVVTDPLILLLSLNLTLLLLLLDLDLTLLLLLLAPSLLLLLLTYLSIVLSGLLLGGRSLFLRLLLFSYAPSILALGADIGRKKRRDRTER